MMKRILSLICALMLLSLLALSASAEVVDTTKRGSISIQMKHGGQAVPGGELTIYRVAEINGAAYWYLPDYASCKESLSDLHSSRLPAALAALVKAKELEGTVGQIDQNGSVKFPDLETGLYLIMQTKAAEGFNAVNPFVVTLPGVKNGYYIYDVDASPKVELEPEETTAPTTTETTIPDTLLPQSGQTNWPIPALTAGGLFLIGIGWCLRCSGRKKSNEK